MDEQNLSIDGVESTAGDLLTVIPNPTTDFLQLEVKNNLPLTEISIYSMQGKLVHTGIDARRVDVSSLASGSYILRYKVANSTAISHTVFLKR